MGDARWVVRPVELTPQPPGTGAHLPAKGKALRPTSMAWTALADVDGMVAVEKKLSLGCFFLCYEIRNFLPR
jgi:hypothetical protein